MSQYQNAIVIQECVLPLGHQAELHIRLLHGQAGDAGRKCIHRIQVAHSGQVMSDIVYLYDPSVPEADVAADFALLSRNGLVSVGQLHHTESMLNRGIRMRR